MPLSGIHGFCHLKAGFPIRIASGMTSLATSGRLTQSVRIILLRLFCFKLSVWELF
jgi:hypothetical protein